MMRRVHAAANWARQLVRTRHFEREMQAEMQSHLEQQAALNHARGMTASEAMAAALREFGNVAVLQEQARDARGTRLIEETKRDLYYGFRALRRTPGFTGVALFSLTLGIAVNTIMFTFMRYVFRPVPVIEPATYVTLNTTISYPAWQQISGERNLFAHTVAYANVSVAIPRPGQDAAPATAQLVSDGFFRMYAMRPLLGRLLVAGEADDAGGVTPLVLSHAFWMRAFGGDSNAVGRTVRLTNGSSFTVVGVASADVPGASRRVPDFWMPLSARLQLPSYQSTDVPAGWLHDPERAWLFMGARLSNGTTVDMARSRLRQVLKRMGPVDAARAENLDGLFLSGEQSGFNRKNAAGVSLMLSATLMVLLIGCANVASLVLARGVRRRREIAVRMSLGASRMRLVRQLMAESTMLSMAGGTLALVLSALLLRLAAAADWFQQTLQNANPIMIAGLLHDTPTVGFTVGVAFLSATVCGLLPALRSTRMDLSSATRDDEGVAHGRRLARSKLRSALIMGQVALSLVLLVSASVLIRSARNAMVMDLGFDREHLVTTSVAVRQAGYTESQRLEFGKTYEALAAGMVGPPNVARGSVPMLPTVHVRINPEEPPRRTSALLTASPTYFSVLGIEIIRGRAFTALEAEKFLPVAVVSETTARRMWPDGNPLGQRIMLASERYEHGVDSLVDSRELTVVGVARDAQLTSVGYTPERLIYTAADTGNVLVHAQTPKLVTPALRDAARMADANVLTSVRTMDELINSLARIQGAAMTAKYTGILGALALTLSLLGIFGVVSYAVSQRTREIGVRLAIGAQRSDVLKMVVLQGMRPVLIGTALGLTLAGLTTRALQVFIFGMSTLDALAYGLAAAGVCTAALLACYIPARRATRIDPVGALRAE